MTADKPVHQRKLAALVRGKGLHGNKFTIELDEENGVSRRSTPSTRTPTPSFRESMSPEVKAVLSSRGDVTKEFGRKSTTVQKEETMKVSESTLRSLPHAPLSDSWTDMSPRRRRGRLSRSCTRVRRR